MPNPSLLKKILDIIINNDVRFSSVIIGSLDSIETDEEINNAINAIKTWPRKSIKSVKERYSSILQKNAFKYISLLSNDEERDAFYEITGDMLFDRIKERQKKQLEDYQKMLNKSISTSIDKTIKGEKVVKVEHNKNVGQRKIVKK